MTFDIEWTPGALKHALDNNVEPDTIEGMLLGNVDRKEFGADFAGDKEWLTAINSTGINENMKDEGTLFVCACDGQGVVTVYAGEWETREMDEGPFAGKTVMIPRIKDQD